MLNVAQNAGWHTPNPSFQLIAVRKQFDDQNPNDQQIMEINNLISQNFEELNNNGLRSRNYTVFLPMGRDPITFDNFDVEEQKEWCLLTQGENTFNLVTVEGARIYISGGFASIKGRPLDAGDILRGKAVIDLLSQREINIDLLPPNPSFFKRLGLCGKIFAVGTTTLAVKIVTASTATLINTLSKNDTSSAKATFSFVYYLSLLSMLCIIIYQIFIQPL